MSILSNELIKKFEVSLVIYKGKTKQVLDRKIKKIFINLKNFNYINFYSKLTKLQSVKKNIKCCDIIVSDNIHEFTKLNKKVYIFANFFWDKIFKKKKIIKLKKGDKIFCNYLFKTSHINKISHHNVPFFQKKIKHNSMKKNILVSIGTSSYKISKSTIRSINQKLKSNIFKKYKFYVDPKIFEQFKKNKNIFKANYSQKMYKKTKFAIIKPGMGTIEECLKHNIAIFAFKKNMNLEFLHNSNTLVKNKLGLSTNTLESCLHLLSKKLNDKNFKLSTKSLKWNGEKKISNILYEYSK